MNRIMLRFPFLFVLSVWIGLATPSISGGMNMVSVETSTGTVEWEVELASDDESRTKGLMFRKSMPENAGMLFRFDEMRPVAMWMKNTFIALDMIFTDETGLITHIHRGAVPQSEAIITSRGPVRYVLEVNHGVVDAVGLKNGDRLRHPWFKLAP